MSSHFLRSSPDEHQCQTSIVIFLLCGQGIILPQQARRDKLMPMFTTAVTVLAGGQTADQCLRTLRGRAWQKGEGYVINRIGKPRHQFR